MGKHYSLILIFSTLCVIHDLESRFPDELEIFVPQDRDFKGYIRIKKGTQVDKDKLIEVKSLFSITETERTLCLSI